MPKLTICGGGNAAHVLIALAGQAGWEVDVFAPLNDEAERLRAGMAGPGGMIAHRGDERLAGRARQVSADPAQVIPGSTLVLLALPAFAHGPTLQTIAGFLEPEAVVGVLPARGGFDYQALSLFAGRGMSPRLFGLQTLPWACRIKRYGQEVEILGTKAATALAAWPGGEAAQRVDILSPLLAVTLTPVSSFLTLTLANTGQLIHPGIMYGLGRGQEPATFSGADIPLFYQGVDDATAAILQQLSDEVQAITGAVAQHWPQFNPAEVPSLYTWTRQAYPDDITDSSTLRRAFNTNRAYAGLRLPTRPVGPDTFRIDYQTRYLAEDVPYGLVVVRGIAELVGVQTPMIDEVITWAQAHLGRQYLVKGRLAGSDLKQTRAPQVFGIQSIQTMITFSQVMEVN